MCPCVCCGKGERVCRGKGDGGGGGGGGVNQRKGRVGIREESA